MKLTFQALVVAAAALGIHNVPLGSAIDTVDSLDAHKYIARWYQVYGNEYTSRTTGYESTCITADYALDEPTGNITVINSARKDSPHGEPLIITGYVYGTNESEPGKLKVHLGQVPVDGDYWIAALGPKTFGPMQLYEWAVVTDSKGLSLFVLARDVPRFDRHFNDEVLELVDDLGFNTNQTKPKRICQEGCLPFDRLGQKEESVMPTADNPRFGVEAWMPHLAQAPAGPFTPVQPVSALDLTRYYGRWYQAYASPTAALLLEQKGACVTADYGPSTGGSVSVINSERSWGVDGKLNQITGHAYYKDPSKPGELTVSLDGVPQDAPYWVLAVGEGDGESQYSYSIVSDPVRAFLFVLVRDIESFPGSATETEVLGLCKELGFTSFWNTPIQTVHEGCTYYDPSARKQMLRSAQPDVPDPRLGVVRSASSAAEALGFRPDPVEPVTALDLERYYGRWYQAYASPSALRMEGHACCVTADYAERANHTMSIVNSARNHGVHGEEVQMTGYAYYQDSSKLGELTVSLDDVPGDGPYWVLALGEGNETDSYTYSIVSDPKREFLFVLVRDIESFRGSKTEHEVLTLCMKLGFMFPWNMPIPTRQMGCTYPEPSGHGIGRAREDTAMLLIKPGVEEKYYDFAPLHASCKLDWELPSSSCEEVSAALVLAAEEMSGFTNCDGGNKCGYTVTQATTSSLALVHETSRKHYKDTMNITLVDEGLSCKAHGSSVSQTWYAILDNGVNYCNLHNLVEASGLAYEESGVSDDTCTQYSSADCERY